MRAGRQIHLSTRALAGIAVAAALLASGRGAPAPAHPLAAGACGRACAGAARAPVPPPLSCRACLVVDDRGRVLFARAADERLPNASTTKIVTALVVVATADGDDVVLVSPGAAATGGGGLDLQPGEAYTVDALLHALLLTSSNDAAVALAEHVAGSEADFVLIPLAPG